MPAPSDFLTECLAGIADQVYTNYEVILLPDESSGTTWPERMREVPTGKIRPAEKRNIGIEQARGTIVAFLDDDAFPTENWLQTAVPHFSDDAIAGVGGPAATPPEENYTAKLSGRVFANYLVSGEYCYRYQPRAQREVEDYPTCNLLVRTAVLRDIGGFRTDFWPGEDTYLCLEIVERSRKIMYDPRVYVYHHRRKLLLPHLRQVARYALHRGWFARKFPRTSRKISYMIPSLFVIGLVAGAMLSLVCPFCAKLYAATLIGYGILTFISAANVNPITWLLTWFGVILTHIVYGARFLAGICGFALPKEVKQFDHVSEGTE